MEQERCSGVFCRKAWHCQTTRCLVHQIVRGQYVTKRIALSTKVKCSYVRRLRSSQKHQVLDIPRLSTKGVAMELVKNAIKLFFHLGKLQQQGTKIRQLMSSYRARMSTPVTLQQQRLIRTKLQEYRLKFCRANQHGQLIGI